MTATQYLALLRGINVGGKNIIKMADLKTCFEGMGLTAVITYIQSGNVLFQSSEKNRAALTRRIEAGLSERFRYESRLVVVARQQLKQVVDEAPRGFGSQPEKFRYDVIFLKAPLTPAEAMKSVSAKEGVDNAHTGREVLYFSRLISRASQSRLTRIISLPIYQSMTIRNWNTTTKLLAMMESGSSS